MQFCLSLGVVSGSSCGQGLFEPSECLWQVWGLILNTIFPLQPSFWGFSFALDVGHLLTATLAQHSHHSRFPKILLMMVKKGSEKLA